MEKLHTLWQKYLEGTLTPEETSQLLDALEQKENHLMFTQWMEKEWDASENTAPKTPENRKRLEKIRKELGMGQSRPIGKLFRYTAAACILALIGLGIWKMTKSTSAGNDFIRLEVAAGEPAKAFLLPDSSSVWLNSATVLQYSGDFTNNREIRLQGEAYFEVTKDRNHPFRVTFRDNRLVVTGTRFLVKSYAGEDISRIGVKEGSVRVYHNSDSTSLKRNNSLFIDELGDTAVFETTNLADIDAWREGVLNFNNIPLGEALNTLERYYGIHINVGTLSGTTIEKHITATYPPGTSLGEVMEGLRHLLDFRYEFTGSDMLKVYETQETVTP